jgi:alpha-glucosidase
VTQYTVDGLVAGASYDFAVQAYGDDGRTSDFSDKIRYVAVPGSTTSFPQVLAVDSQETARENGTGGNALDGNQATLWHTQWSGQAPPHPHYIIIDLGAPRTVYGLRYLPRQDGRLNGTIVRYEVYLSLDSNQWEPSAWISGSWEPTANDKIVVQSSGQRGRYLKLVATAAANGGPWTSAAEIQVIGTLP